MTRLEEERNSLFSSPSQGTCSSTAATGVVVPRQDHGIGRDIAYWYPLAHPNSQRDAVPAGSVVCLDEQLCVSTDMPSRSCITGIVVDPAMPYAVCRVWYSFMASCCLVIIFCPLSTQTLTDVLRVVVAQVGPCCDAKLA